MDLNKKTYKTTIMGKEASLEFSDLANQADGAVFGRYGETTVFATVVMGDKDSDRSFFPLTVDYEEKFYAVGKILGSRFMRREGQPSKEATLSARLIDRTIRPLFDQRMKRAVQVTVTILSYDGENDLKTISLLAASAALATSRIPWNGPVAGARIENKDETYDSFFAGPKGLINMIEFEGKEISEEKIAPFFDEAQKEIDRLVEFQEKISKEIGVEKEKIEFSEPDEDLKKAVESLIESELKNVDVLDKAKISELNSLVLEKVTKLKGETEAGTFGESLFDEGLKRWIKNRTINSKKRPDGRATDELRPLHAEVGVLPRVHGSALFIRGNTQVLAITTLAPPGFEKLVDSMVFSGKNRFMLDYNFPGFSTGETKGSRGPGRREIGHGALAMKAIEPFLPEKESFPYTMRIVTEVLSSNGSTSMASTCAALLSLMDAGVPVENHVSGIAMGLVSDDKGNWEVLTDIQGLEDHYGDMDFKIAGTEKGISAIQVDTKIRGIDKDIFVKTLSQGKEARLEIREVLKKALPAPKPEISPYAPAIIVINVPEDKIGGIIGPGGKTINGIIDLTGDGTSIDIESDGTVFVSGKNREQAEKAVSLIKEIIREYEVGEIVEGTVEKILDFGAIVEFGGGRDGMIHVSELADKYVEKVTDIVNVGDKVKAKIVKMENGKVGLSLKGVQQDAQ